MTSRSFRQNPLAVGDDFDLSFHDGDFNKVFEPGGPKLSITELRRDLLDRVRATLASQKLNAEDAKTHIEGEFSALIKECKTGGEDPTILHWLAKKLKLDSIPERDMTFSAASLLAEIATSKDPAMLSTQDRESKSTPIHLFTAHAESARKGVGDIILRMCHAAEQQPAPGIENYASRAIASQNKEGKNCLHIAVRKTLDITQDLIRMSPADAVLATRDKGNTPLHDAVDPAFLLCEEQICNNKVGPSKTCTKCEAKTRKAAAESRHLLGVVAALITKEPRTLMKKNDQDQSPYMLHQQSRRQATRQLAGSSKPKAVAKDKDMITLQPEGSVIDKDGTVSNAAANAVTECESIPSDTLDKEIEKYLVESAFALGGFENACKCFFGKPNRELPHTEPGQTEGHERNRMLTWIFT
jgi:hypothetical protein